MPAQTSSNPAAVGSPNAAHGVSATIVLALVAIFALHYLGFRFVVAAGVGR